MRINLNKVAKAVAKKEGKKIQVNIAQIKEVIKCFLDVVNENYKISEIVELMERYAPL